jgi:hypothetical protein
LDRGDLPGVAREGGRPAISTIPRKGLLRAAPYLLSGLFHVLLLALLVLAPAEQAKSPGDRILSVDVLTREEFAAIAGAAKKADRAVEKPIAEAETSAANAPDATSAPPPGPPRSPLRT